MNTRMSQHRDEILVPITLSSDEGSGKPTQMRRLATHAQSMDTDKGPDQN